MSDFRQGDIVKIKGFQSPFLIISKNAFIKSTGMFHVCPFLPDVKEGPIHIAGNGKKGLQGIFEYD